MKIFLSFLFVICFLKLQSQNCKINIGGDTCVFTNLSAHISKGSPKALIWKSDTTIMMVRTPKGYTTGTIAAGNNFAGAGLNQLNNPYDVAVDDSGNVFIADANNNRVVKWMPDATAGIIVAGGNGGGCASNQLNMPQQIALDSKGNLYILVSCGSNADLKIKKWKQGAVHGSVIIQNLPGVITDMFCDGSGTIYTVDKFYNRVIKYSPPDYIPVIAAGGNGQGAALNQLSNPSCIFVDSIGNMYIGDGGNGRIVKWAKGARSGIVAATSQPYNSNYNPFFPANSIFSYDDLYVDKTGIIYVLDAYAMRVQAWNASNQYWINFYTDKLPGRDYYNYENTITGMDFDKNMNLYLCSRQSNTVKKYDLQNTLDTTYQTTRIGNYSVALRTTNNCESASPAIYVSDIPENHGISGQPYNLCHDSIQTYTAFLADNHAYYNWKVTAGLQIISGQGTSQLIIKVLADGKLSLIPTNGCGTANTSSIKLFRRPAAPSGILGATNVNANQKSIHYSVSDSLPGLTYTWTFPTGVTITSGQGTPKITVNWGNVGGTVSVVAQNSCGVSDAGTKQVNLKTAFTSNNAIVKNTLLVNNLTIFPNPVKDLLNVQFKSQPGNYALIISDITGKTITHKNIQAAGATVSTTIDVSKFSKGIYLLKLQSENGKAIKKFIVE